MDHFAKHRINYTLLVAFVLWLFLPATTPTTVNATFYELGTGYAPVASFRYHPNPPKINSMVFKKLVWRHERYSLLWLPFGGSTAGEYGLYKVRNSRYVRTVYFIPLSFAQAQKYASMVNVKLNEGSPISYWSLFCGWLFLVPIGLIVYWAPEPYDEFLDPIKLLFRRVR